MTDRSQTEHHATPAKIQVKRGFSLVWIVPIVALVIGGWLAFKAIKAKGPIIAITFTTSNSHSSISTFITCFKLTIIERGNNT